MYSVNYAKKVKNQLFELFILCTSGNKKLKTERYQFYELLNLIINIVFPQAKKMKTASFVLLRNFFTNKFYFK